MFSFTNGPPRRSLLSNVWSPVPAQGKTNTKFK
jgi:hypothetical protein